MDVIERRIGLRRMLAVEFEVKPYPGVPVNEWWGSLWLWVEGRCVGEPSEFEMVSIGLSELVFAAKHTGSRVNSLLSSFHPDQALDAVMHSVYGRDDQTLLEVRDSESLSVFDILPTSAGPSFDGWEATLLEEGEYERFIYRRSGDSAREARWKLGTFRDIIMRANFEFLNLDESRERNSETLQ